MHSAATVFITELMVYSDLCTELCGFRPSFFLESFSISQILIMLMMCRVPDYRGDTSIRFALTPLIEGMLF